MGGPAEKAAVVWRRGGRGQAAWRRVTEVVSISIRTHKTHAKGIIGYQ